MKCKDYQKFSVLCQPCNIKEKVRCSKEFEFDVPKKYIRVERPEMMNTSWNECPTCGKSIGYYPKDEEFKCPRCNQRILW